MVSEIPENPSDWTDGMSLSAEGAVRTDLASIPGPGRVLHPLVALALLPIADRQDPDLAPFPHHSHSRPTGNKRWATNGRNSSADWAIFSQLELC